MWKEVFNLFIVFFSVMNRYVCFLFIWSNFKMIVIDISFFIIVVYIVVLIWIFVWIDIYFGSIISRYIFSIMLIMYCGIRSWRSVKMNRKSERGKKK